jgi:hypothetical protein
MQGDVQQFEEWTGSELVEAAPMKFIQSGETSDAFRPSA